eukprot:TRINITY_DN5991_c0_g1_i11.p1 TRINITY_DN5991_c0_g1~~TRINITY_DN5991_c0_g1_i11.p1  ORF type:complete len:246 (-),score=-2.88 TRINITY_DN5991_c0_g1_i11:103-840(-)
MRYLESDPGKTGAEALRVNPNLTRLSFELDKVFASDEELHEVSESLSLLTRLTIISFKIYRVASVTDKGCKSTISTIGKLPALSNLRFIVEKCRGLTDQTLYSLDCSNLTSITKLTLTFKQTGVSDNGLGFLAHNLNHLPLLSSFNLNVSRTSISDIGVLQLTEALSNRPHLSTLSLYMEGCRSITSVSARYILVLLRIRTTLVDVIFDVKRTQMRLGIKSLQQAQFMRKFDRFILLTRRNRSHT